MLAVGTTNRLDAGNRGEVANCQQLQRVIGQMSCPREKRVSHFRRAPVTVTGGVVMPSSA